LQKAKAPDSLLNRINNEGQSAVNELKEYAGNFIKNSADPVFTLFVLGSFKSFFSMEEYGDALNNAATKFPGNQSLIVAKQMFDDQKAASRAREIPQETSWVGKKAPEFSLPDVNGNQIKLSSFHGKYVLVDFWASWCSPCRRENPNVVKAWGKFKNKNFTILGVSLDRPGEKDKWLNAIKDDNLTWNHVSDLNYWNSEVVPLYKITGIPYNILIDPDGTIIGEKLFGDQLEEKLAEVLK
jgi:peroxiredoxin